MQSESHIVSTPSRNTDISEQEHFFLIPENSFIKQNLLKKNHSENVSSVNVNSVAKHLLSVVKRKGVVIVVNMSISSNFWKLLQALNSE